MLRGIVLLATLAVLPLQAVANISQGDDQNGRWSTTFDRISHVESRKWHSHGVFVDVPRSLTVSEAETWAPEADIVWRGDPAGDRYQQVDNIITGAFTRAVSGLKGPRGVYFYVRVTEFHSLTNKARYGMNNVGVHNIKFLVQIRDEETGQNIGPVYSIKADLAALSGDQARAADAQGRTQKKRVSAYISNVVYSWLGYGKDERRSFNRPGR